MSEFKHEDVTATNKALPSANPEAPAQSDDQHTEDVAEMFGRMTKWYDLQNRVFSLWLDCWWRRNLVRSVVPGPTKHVIDMAAGTLDVSLALLRRYPELRVTATDICEPMLRYGMEKKVRPTERARITSMVADARHMPFEDGCADAVTIAFGIRNVRPRMDALREMHRLLVPGGRACILEFAPVSTPVFGPFYHWYLKNVMPKLAGLVSRSNNAFDYFAPEIFKDEMKLEPLPAPTMPNFSAIFLLFVCPKDLGNGVLFRAPSYLPIFFHCITIEKYSQT